ncbi:MAG TPA: DUF3644 domain-containing protein [Patescibacteria group bacterium]|nr:DUF3644 domain-containing protein [Patescibacteria group bacterium]
MTTRNRRVGSVKQELVNKSREAALAAVQVFNNPLITFKSEMFIVNMHIAWTYLLHAYYRSQKIEYRYFQELPSGRKKFDRTKHGAYKYWELERCLGDDTSPVDKNAANNLRFLIGLRHEIEHQMTSRIDDALSARFQACCLNFNDCIKTLFGTELGIDKHLSFSLQFTSLSDSQTSTLQEYKDILPAHVSRFVEGYDGNLSEEEFNSPKYAYRVLFAQKTANRPGQADKVIEFIAPDSEIAKGMNITYAVTKEKEKDKSVPSKIVKMMNDEGYPNFKLQNHTVLWQQYDAKKPTKGYGVELEGRWYWYDNWINIVRQHCQSNKRKYQ